jgi:cation diffusion facilitator family transporter
MKEELNNSGNKSNNKKAIMVLWIVMFLNFAVAIFKMIVGTIANSGSIVADGYHSLSDGSGNIVGITGLFIAGRPEDESHPYGHKKFETISSLMISALLFAVGCKVAFSAVTNIINPKIPEISTLSFAVMITTLVVNIFVVKYERSQGLKLSSDVLVSDSEHTKSDIMITSGVILTMVLLKFGFPPVIDGIVSLLISGFIFKASYEIFTSSSNVLADAAALSSEEICETVMTCEGVMGCHKVRSRGRQDDIHIDLHALTHPEMSVAEAHVLNHTIEKALKVKYGDQVSVIVHIEPFVDHESTVK